MTHNPDQTPVHHLFTVFGVELELMLVDAETFDVLPVADLLLRQAADSDAWVEDLDWGTAGWSNELVAHVVELKNPHPVPDLGELSGPFQESVARLLAVAHRLGGRFMPGAMHPWMDPVRETRIWPHESAPIYRAYDRLYDCRRHGWANLQSVHLNLPFADEQEFGRLMAALRLVLPLIPALAAASPFVEGARSGVMDKRLQVYGSNALRTPAMAGEVIPEPVYDYTRYRREVLAPISAQLRGLGAPPMLLDQEWLNARGAIARFDRMAIEVRLIDAQESIPANLAVAAAVAALTRALVEQRWSGLAAQQGVASALLVEQLKSAITCASAAPPVSAEYLQLFGSAARGVSTLGQLWARLLEELEGIPKALAGPLECICRHGTLAERLLTATPARLDGAARRELAQALCACLERGVSFTLRQRPLALEMSR